MSEISSRLPNIRRLLSGGELNLPGLRKYVPGVASTLGAVEKILQDAEGGKLSPEAISSWHRKPTDRDYSTLTADEMQLLKSEPGEFLAKYPDAALGFDISKVQFGNAEGGGTTIMVEYQGQDGEVWNLILVKPSTKELCDRVTACDTSKRNKIGLGLYGNDVKAKAISTVRLIESEVNKELVA